MSKILNVSNQSVSIVIEAKRTILGRIYKKEMNKKYWTDYTYINYCSLKDFEKFIEKKNYNINKIHKDGTTGLMLSIYRKKEDFSLFFLKNGADVSIRSSKGWTALHFAIYFNMFKVAKEILKIDKKVLDIKSNDGIDPLFMAAHYDGGFGKRIFKLLLNNSVDKKKIKDLFKMVKSLSYYKLIKLIEYRLKELN